MLRRDVLKVLGAVPTAALARYVNDQATFQPTWESIDTRPIPEWYTDAKFGIFIHWGVYSVPAYAAVNVKDENPYAEWYWNSLTDGMQASASVGHGAMTWAFHKRMYGPDFQYVDFAPMFRAELFDPDAWADLFVQSGARYVALTSKHHEGFTLWRSAEANRSWRRAWNSVDIGPKRDLLFDLMNAGRRKGLHMGIYYSLYEWYNPLWLTDKSAYVRAHMFPQFKDVVTHAEPEIIFSDGEWELTSAEWHSPELLAWLFNESPVRNNVVIDDRWGKDTRHKHGGYYTTEYTSGMQHSGHAWEESRGMGYSYGYNRAETLRDYHTGRQLTLMLIDIVSRGGNLLLDIGPRADGMIPVVMQERLVQIGEWLRPNGEAIYGTKPWARAAQWSEGKLPHLEESEFRSEYQISDLVDNPKSGNARIEAFFTSKADAVYAILPSRSSRFLLKDVTAREHARIVLLVSGQDLKWTKEGQGIAIEVPDQQRSEALVLKLTGVKAG